MSKTWLIRAAEVKGSISTCWISSWKHYQYICMVDFKVCYFHTNIETFAECIELCSDFIRRTKLCLHTLLKKSCSDIEARGLSSYSYVKVSVKTVWIWNLCHCIGPSSFAWTLREDDTPSLQWDSEGQTWGKWIFLSKSICTGLSAVFKDAITGGIGDLMCI